MKELFEATFSLINIIPTGLLVFIIIYWITVLVGLVHFKSIDLHIHPDSHIDLHHDIHIHSESSGHVHAHSDSHSHDHSHSENQITEIGGLATLFRFFNLGRVPLMIYLSLFAIPFWVFSVLSNYYLNNQSILFSFILLIPNFIVCLMLTKITTTPFVYVFEKMETGTTKDESFIGKTGVVLLPVGKDKFGQVEITANNKPVVLNAISCSDSVYAIGEKVFVMEYNEESSFYVVCSYNSD